MRVRSFIIFLFLSLAVSSVLAQHKKNSRPGIDNENNSSAKKTVNTDAKEPVYFYEFSKPEFVVAKILLEHDEYGKGKITFFKRDFEEEIVEPLNLSEKTLEKIKTLWAEIDFLESNEKYQSPERDYAHLGTMKLTMKKGGKERTEELNWTENAQVKALTDEYRKIGNQFVWMFDMNVARENQPLESPRIMKRIDSYLKRNEISDPKQLIPFLKEISDDERYPLITRNHATRLLKQIEKVKEEKK